MCLFNSISSLRSCIIPDNPGPADLFGVMNDGNTYSDSLMGSMSPISTICSNFFDGVTKDSRYWKWLAVVWFSIWLELKTYKSVLSIP